MSGSDVKDLQNFLITGNFLAIGNNTGYFGNLTKSALINYQKSAGINPTGYFGPITQKSLSSQALIINTPVSTNTNTLGQKITKALAYGMSNDQVRILQTILARDTSIYPEGSVTGYFGPATLRAVKAFQTKYNIANFGDVGYGFVGPATRAKLNSLIK